MDILLVLDGGDVSVLTIPGLFSAFDTSTTIFSSTDFNLFLAFLAPFFRGLRLTSLTHIVTVNGQN